MLQKNVSTLTKTIRIFFFIIFAKKIYLFYYFISGLITLLIKLIINVNMTTVALKIYSSDDSGKTYSTENSCAISCFVVSFWLQQKY